MSAVLRPSDLDRVESCLGDALAEVSRLREALTAPVADLLVDDVVVLLSEQHPPIIGLSGSEIARRLHRNRIDVLAVLRDRRYFVRHGSGRGTRFRLAPGIGKPKETDYELRGRAPSAKAGSEAIPGLEHAQNGIGEIEA